MLGLVFALLTLSSKMGAMVIASMNESLMMILQKTERTTQPSYNLYSNSYMHDKNPLSLSKNI